MTGTNCDLFTHNQSRSYLNHLVFTIEDVKRDHKEVGRVPSHVYKLPYRATQFLAHLIKFT
jgi:hypothetical protein